jgi:hypothetical protein
MVMHAVHAIHEICVMYDCAVQCMHVMYELQALYVYVVYAMYCMWFLRCNFKICDMRLTFPPLYSVPEILLIHLPPRQPAIVMVT